MEFNKAKNGCGEIIMFEEIKNSTNLKELREDLRCPTKGCEARLLYIAALNPYLKTYNNSKHSDNCPHRKENIETKRKQRTKQLYQLSEAEVYSRLDGFSDYFYPEEKVEIDKPKTSTKHKPKSKLIDNADDIKSQGVASVKSGDNASKNVKPPRVKKKHLNEIVISDQGSILQIGGQLRSIEKFSNMKYILKIKDPKINCYGEILLKSNYFSRKVQGINKQLDFLMNYLKNNPGNYINIAFYGSLLNAETRQFEVFDDYGFKLYMMKKKKIKKYTLAKFYFEYNH